MDSTSKAQRQFKGGPELEKCRVGFGGTRIHLLLDLLALLGPENDMCGQSS